jgi:hypothetical protein
MIESIIQKMIEEALKVQLETINEQLDSLKSKTEDNTIHIEHFDFSVNHLIDDRIDDRIDELECELEQKRNEIPNDLEDRILHIENFLLKTLKGFDK